MKKKLSHGLMASLSTNADPKEAIGPRTGPEAFKGKPSNYVIPFLQKPMPQYARLDRQTGSVPIAI